MPEREREQEISDGELGVLKALWDIGPASVRTVMEHLHNEGRKVAYTTVLTFLSRLEQKGYASSDKTGQAYVYRATMSRNKVTKARLKDLVENLFDGAAAPLVLQLMKTEKFTADEVAELQKLIDQLDSKA
ncbi:MAG TPA: BlaI/MecI/CopY family transcriptional regulator [Phycisphaerales bacterium]|nr:BlaI/MecI/CopY family transcriptional regulator [Phycisphaerales bacterium]